jgi:hypothetical protein
VDTLTKAWQKVLEQDYLTCSSRRVEMRLLHEDVDLLGVARIWQMSCTLPEHTRASCGLPPTGLDGATLRRRMLGLLSYGGTTLARSLEASPDRGSFSAETTVMQFVPADAHSQES